LDLAAVKDPFDPTPVLAMIWELCTGDRMSDSANGHGINFFELYITAVHNICLANVLFYPAPIVHIISVLTPDRSGY